MDWTITLSFIAIVLSWLISGAVVYGVYKTKIDSFEKAFTEFRTSVEDHFEKLEKELSEEHSKLSIALTAAKIDLGNLERNFAAYREVAIEKFMTYAVFTQAETRMLASLNELKSDVKSLIRQTGLPPRE